MSRNIYWMLLQSVWLFLAGGMRGPHRPPHLRRWFWTSPSRPLN